MKVQGGLKRIIVFSCIFLSCKSVVYAAPTVTYGGNFNLPILDRQNWGSPLTEAVINVPDHFTIYDLDVGINIIHTNVFDLQIAIRNPLGKQILLNHYDTMSEFFKGENYIQTIFDDEAPMSIQQGSAPFTGRFRPKSGASLQVFDGQDAYGLWRLQIHDLWYWDTGTLESVELIFSLSETAKTIPTPSALILLTFGAGLITIFRRRLTA